ncbi:MAG: hypothetical protein AVDCRST_MAG64-3266, partial [uncultured Phycisphaerae bacterium]
GPHRPIRRDPAVDEFRGFRDVQLPVPAFVRQVPQEGREAGPATAEAGTTVPRVARVGAAAGVAVRQAEAGSWRGRQGV